MAVSPELKREEASSPRQSRILGQKQHAEKGTDPLHKIHGQANDKREKRSCSLTLNQRRKQRKTTRKKWRINNTFRRVPLLARRPPTSDLCRYEITKSEKNSLFSLPRRDKGGKGELREQSMSRFMIRVGRDANLSVTLFFSCHAKGPVGEELTSLTNSA